METSTREFVMNVMDHARDMTLATMREDGYPQATTVSYAHDGLTLYVGIGKDSQKANNIRHNNKVSLTINEDYGDWNHIKGLSIGGVAEIVDDFEEISRATDCMLKRFPELKEWEGTEEIGHMVFLKIKPEIISVLDYQKGFGHAELVKV